MEAQFVIVGAGFAGAKAAEALRAEGFDGRIVVIGEESERPYERPPLSKSLLLGTAERESAFVHAADWYKENDVELRIGVRATRLDRSARTVALSDGTTVPYDRLLLATGSRPRRLNVPGADTAPVRYLRTIADCERLSPDLHAGARVVVIGAGWIGLEVAAAARTLGASVHVVEMAALPLQRVLGDEIATVFRDLHTRRGVTFHFSATVAELRPDAVVLGDGTELPADVVVVGVGVEPNVELATDAGLTVANGIVVDATLRTSDPHIFAAGDVANVQHPVLGLPVRVEHWDTALQGGATAGRAMLGRDVTYERVPYFFTDQYSDGMEYTGYVAPGGYDEVVIRRLSSVESVTPELIAFWVKDSRVLAGMNLNVWDVQEEIRALVRAGYAGITVEPARLADPAVPLADVIR
jgi:NADPH-dependent 2,4-dienoyl-CoA reductase/sulfur reductase-like enzyme